MSEMISNESNESNGDGLTALYRSVGCSDVFGCYLRILQKTWGQSLSISTHQHLEVWSFAFASPEFASTPPCPYAEVRSSELKTWLELDRNGSLRAG